ncbi:hypothetical protein ACI7YT_12630 [Microbacterium sp. M]|uniref:hypothetical protein n=1 Tax=Microbacterium sp. M TaxID=3377125 RepID=UPI003863A5AF
MTKPWMGVTPPPRGHGYYPDEAPFEPSYTGTGFYEPALEFRERTTEYGVALQEWFNGILKREYEIREEALTTTVVKALRSKGWTVEPPTSEPVDEHMRATEDMLERHAEKQGCSRGDAWNYFRGQGYEVEHLDYFRDKNTED